MHVVKVLSQQSMYAKMGCTGLVHPIFNRDKAVPLLHRTSRAEYRRRLKGPFNPEQSPSCLFAIIA